MRPPELKSFLQVVAGPILLLLSLAGTVWGVRATMAQHLYFRARYGAYRNDTGRILKACEEARGLYPKNHLFCQTAADAAFVDASKASGQASLDLLSASRKWCDIGLGLNRYSRDLTLRKAGLLGMDPRTRLEAVKCWEDYTDWHYWHPENQYLLGSMYALTGQFEKAEERAGLLKNFEHHAPLVKFIAAEKAGRKSSG